MYQKRKMRQEKVKMEIKKKIANITLTGINRLMENFYMNQ